MFTLQILTNGLVLGCLYACIAAGFSLVWGVLNVINLMHGSFIVLGSYLAWAAYNGLGISPWITLLIAAPLFYGLGWLLQRSVLNRVITAPVLVTLTLTFGLDLMLNNAMLVAFKADYRKLILDPPLDRRRSEGVLPQLGDAIAEQCQCRVDLAAFPALDDRLDDLPGVVLGGEEVATITEHLGHPDEIPGLQFAQAGADVRPCDAERLGDLVGVQGFLGEEQQCMDLRDRAVHPPSAAHLSPVDDVALHERCELHEDAPTKLLVISGITEIIVLVERLSSSSSRSRGQKRGARADK